MKATIRRHAAGQSQCFKLHVSQKVPTFKLYVS